MFGRQVCLLARGVGRMGRSRQGSRDLQRERGARGGRDKVSSPCKGRWETRGTYSRRYPCSGCGRGGEEGARAEGGRGGRSLQTETIRRREGRAPAEPVSSLSPIYLLLGVPRNLSHIRHPINSCHSSLVPPPPLPPPSTRSPVDGLGYGARYGGFQVLRARF